MATAKANKSQTSGYFTQVLDIIDHLTYIDVKEEKDGTKSYYRRRLTPADKDLYRIILKTAGLDGKCWKSTLTLAQESNCSTGSIVKSKKRLLECFEQLNGASLIELEVRHQATLRLDDDGNKKTINKKFVHHIRCTDIRKKSDRFMKSLKTQGSPRLGLISKEEAEIAMEKMRQSFFGHDPESVVDKSGARSLCEQAGGARSRDECASRGARSRGEPNHTKRTISHKDIETYPALSREQEMLLTDYEVKSFATDVAGWLKKFGVHRKVVSDLLNRFSVSSLANAINRFRNTSRDFVVLSTWCGALLSHINRVCRLEVA